MDVLYSSTARRPRRVWLPLTLLALALLLLAAAATVALVLAERGRLPANATVAGVDVGSKTPAEARDLVRAAAERRLDLPILLTAPGLELETSGRELGATPDVEGAIERADDTGLLDRLGARLGIGGERVVPVRYRFDAAGYDDVYARLADRLDREPRSARIRVRAAGIDVVPAEVGLAVGRERLRRALARLPREAAVPVGEIAPEVTNREAARAARVAGTLVEEPRTIRAGEQEVVLRRSLLRRALRFPVREGAPRVELSVDVIRRVLRSRLRRLERPARDASFVVSGERVRVRPSQPGRRLALERVAASIVRNRASLVHRARFVAVPPAFTTEEAEKLEISELVSEFTTYYSCCQPRVTNIQRAAELLDGTIIRPGGTFSMNEALGKRTEEHGFVAAPQIFNGRLEDAVGGGISQVATTLYNAAFFSGIELVQHQAHQFYISRYPMGREATVSWGGPELVFRNDWPAAILMKVSASDTAISVRFYSAKLGRRVETETGEPYAYTAPRTIRIPNRSLPPGTTSTVQSAGSSGFTVQYTRRVYRGDKLLKDERYTVRYDPQNAIVEVGPPKPKAKPKPKDTKKAGAGQAPEPGDASAGEDAPAAGPPASGDPPQQPPPAATTSAEARS